MTIKSCMTIVDGKVVHERSLRGSDRAISGGSCQDFVSCRKPLLFQSSPDSGPW